jgi:hypothetical protein
MGKAPQQPQLAEEEEEEEEETETETAEVQNHARSQDCGHESMECTPSSSTAFSEAKTETSIALDSIEDLVNEENMEQDAAQIYDIVQRYYHYHQRYNAGDAKDFQMPVEERLEQPLDQLLTWSMVAFESIEEDFLTTFHDKAIEDEQRKPGTAVEIEKQDASAASTTAARKVSLQENAANSSEKKSDANATKAMHVHPLERVGLFDVGSGSSGTTSSRSSDNMSQISDNDDDDRSLSFNGSNGSMFYYRCAKNSLVGADM